MAEKLAQDVAELSGIIKGPTEVVKQQASNQNITFKHIDDLAKQIKDVSEVKVLHLTMQIQVMDIQACVYPKFNCLNSKVKFPMI